ncbi:hypothetical protein [Geothrix edaphica]|uniref:Uncharacterized protein n=1 Tax=Geothrix edaphica TaxID=2927976 RepID=A0ABQ5Q1N5_9BACT|nr:hypothetical protein [Geothrix edaphica]GLH68458.1 hypothetical protein GETHED_28220 [Geothrix edaphica]
MLLNPELPWPLKLTAWFLLVQGISSLAGTILSVVQHRPSVDLTVGSILLGFGLLRLNNLIRWLTVISLTLQLLMCAWVLRDLLGDPGLTGDSRMFSYILFDPGPSTLAFILGAMILVLSLQGIYLVMPGTRRLFRVGSTA